MASCRIVNQSVVTAVDDIRKIADKYKTLGENFVKDLNSAINEMEGATKDALKDFIAKSVSPFVHDQIPVLIGNMADLLEGNRDNFEKVDAQIATSIAGGG